MTGRPWTEKTSFQKKTVDWKLKANIKKLIRIFFLIIFIGLIAGPAQAGSWQDKVKALANGGTVVVADETGKPVFSVNPDKRLIPASILKIITASAVLDILGPDYRFVTEFRVSPDHDLYVIGKGDPYLVSEELDLIAKNLKTRGLSQVRDIYLDGSYFEPNLELHGGSRSLNPYDAYNGALCVNFNTIFVSVDKRGRVASAEPQTPITDFAVKAALKSKSIGEVRINLSGSPDDALMYAGALIKAFLEKHGVKVNGSIKKSTGGNAGSTLYYRHQSSQDLTRLVQQFLKFSNNFMTNQIFLAAGAQQNQPPASVKKSRQAMEKYFLKSGLPKIYMEEGSGLSRRTKITGRLMIAVLNKFRPFMSLLASKDKVRLKTGTLSDVKTMAGYLPRENAPPYAFVIMLNGKTATFQARSRIFDLLKLKVM